MPASFKRLKQRAYEAIIAAPNRDWRKMLARKRAHALISATAATAVCLTISSTAPALLEGASIRPMDEFSDGGSGIGGLRNLFPDDSRQSVSVFAAVGYASTSPAEAAASYDCVETPAASTMGGSASAAPTNGGIICLGPHDAIEFHELRGNADRGGVEHAMDVVPSSVRSHIGDDQLFVSTSHDDGSAPRESSGATPGRKASKLGRRFDRVDIACTQGVVFAHSRLLSLRTDCSVVSEKCEVFRRRIGYGFRSGRSVCWRPAAQRSSARGVLAYSLRLAGRPRPRSQTPTWRSGPIRRSSRRSLVRSRTCRGAWSSSAPPGLANCGTKA